MSLLDGRFIEVSAEDILLMQSASPQDKLMFMNELLRQVLAIQEQLELQALGAPSPPPHGGTTELPVRSSTPGPHRMVPQRVDPSNDVDVGDDPRGLRDAERAQERRAATTQGRVIRGKGSGGLESGQKIPHRDSTPTGQRVRVEGRPAQIERFAGDNKTARLRYEDKPKEISVAGKLTGDMHRWDVQPGDAICAAPEIRSKVMVGRKGQQQNQSQTTPTFSSAKKTFLITG